MSNKLDPIVLDAGQTLDLDLAGIKLIEASAGTGKTYAIGNLYLRHILAGRSVREILVVTFTNAATEELRGRIRQRLYEALRVVTRISTLDDEFLNLWMHQIENSGDAELQLAINRLKLAVRTMDEAAIYTIHGFCQRALTDHAFNSGQAFQVELINDDSDLWGSAMKDWWRQQSYELDRIELGFFVDALGNLPGFIKWQLPLRTAFNSTIIPVIEADLQAMFGRFHGMQKQIETVAETWRKRSGELQDVLRNSPALSRGPYRNDLLGSLITEWDAYFSSEHLLPISASLEKLSAKYLQEHSKPKKRGTDLQLEDPFFIDCQQIWDSKQRMQQEFKIVALQEATDYAREQVEKTKRSSHILSFQDQLTWLNEALEHSSELAVNLRSSFPVALIDEFQDTDAIQYGIFRALYFDQQATSLIMIGDPRQAIYSFRGGDIFTYMKAKLDARGHHYTLNTNWRSTPELITAINSVFGFREAPFIYSDAIDYRPVSAAAKKNQAVLRDNGVPAKALTIWQIPGKENGQPPGREETREVIHQVVSNEVMRLIEGGMQGQLMLGERTVRPGDIAVLVRSIREGSALRLALSEIGIHSVTVGRENVFQTDEAIGLLWLLEAIIQPTDRDAARKALGSSLLDYDYQAMAAIIEHETAWLEWVEQIARLNWLWQNRGFMPMFQGLLQDLETGMQLAAAADAERKLTNTLHLAELLQQAAKSHPGHAALLAWFRQQVEASDGTETELRLESDAELVKIVTIHSSKGLEYPIVFVPYLWSCVPVQKNAEMIRYHDQDNHSYLDFNAKENKYHLCLAEKERLGEDLRLLYVALTRAKAKVYLAWGNVGSGIHSSGRTALGYLLQPDQRAVDLDSNLPHQFDPASDTGKHLVDLVSGSADTIEVLPLPSVADNALEYQEAVPQAGLSAAEFTGKIAADYMVSSFSSLTRDIHQPAHGGSPRFTDEVLNFPAGSQVGLFLHLLLEKMDFVADIADQVRALAHQFAPRFNLDAHKYEHTLIEWFQNLVSTPLNSNGFCLGQLPRQRRLDELEFDFSVERIHVVSLNKVLEQAAGRPLANITVADFRGMITGLIDLVFEFDGKYYLADYKSNFLGGALEDYAPDILEQAIYDRRYDLQYLIYSLALHRFLGQRVRDYSYAQHFGGVYYLFLRGMRPLTGTDFGVFYNCPDEQLIETLDQQIFSPMATVEVA